MGFHQDGRHGKWVVEVGERGLRKLRAGVEQGLGSGFDLLLLRIARMIRPGEVIVD
jgi:hypothetical protein